MEFVKNLGGSFGAKEVILHQQSWVHKTKDPEREVRAYEIYKALLPYKRGNWYVPETIYGPPTRTNVLTSLQSYITFAATYGSIDSCQYAAKFRHTFDPVTGGEAAAFDFIIGQTDRHHYNFLIDMAGQLVLIDHGNAFDFCYLPDHAFVRHAPSYCVNYWTPARDALATILEPLEYGRDALARFDQLPNFTILDLDNAHRAALKC